MVIKFRRLKEFKRIEGYSDTHKQVILGHTKDVVVLSVCDDVNAEERQIWSKNLFPQSLLAASSKLQFMREKFCFCDQQFCIWDVKL